MAINLYGYNTQRISGLASGMDTQTIVNNLMATQQLKLDKVFRQKERTQWKLEAYTELNTAVSSLRNTYLSVLGSKSLTKSSAYNAYKVAMEENSAVKITGTANALPSNMKILEAVRASAASASNKVADTRQTELRSTAGQFLQASAKASIEIGAGAGLGSTIEELADQFGLKPEDESLSFAINGETFTFERSASMQEVIDGINAKTDKTGVKIGDSRGVVDRDGKRYLEFAFESEKLGKDSQIRFTNITGTAFGDKVGFGVDNTKVERSSAYTSAAIQDKTFAQLAQDAGVELHGDTFTINGEKFSLKDGERDKTVREVMDEVNGTLANVRMSYDEASGNFVLRNTAGAGQAPISVSGALFGEKSLFGVKAGSHSNSGALQRADTLAVVARKLGYGMPTKELKVTINGEEFVFNTHTTTISDMMSKINQNKDAKAAFSYSEITGAFQISSTQTGSESTLSYSFGAFGAIFGLAEVDAATPLKGTDAQLHVKMNGQSETTVITQASNSFTLDGLAFEITGDKNFGAEGLDVRVERDFQPTLDAVKGFIEEYNKVVGALTTKYYEKDVSRKYPPLTEEERASLSEKEAEKWDAEAKSGVLRNDVAVGSLLTSLRSALNAKVGDTGMSALDLGISTVPWASATWRTEQGKLTLDEDKFLAALKENPNAVQEVLTKISTNDNGSTDTSVKMENGLATAGSGLLTRMGSFLSSFNLSMNTRNIQDTQKALAGYSERMSSLLKTMAQKEESYWAKYSKMETMLSQMQSQQNWLSAQLGLATNGNQ